MNNTENIGSLPYVPELKKNRWNIATLILIFVILIVIGAAFFYFSILPNIIQQAKQSVEKTKWCEGVNITFFAGGPENSGFSQVIYKGVQDAQKDLGCNVKTLWSDWSSEKMLSQFKESINESPDGIAVMGHPGNELMSPFIDEAERKGIIITSQNTDITQSRVKYISKGFGYVGPDNYAHGFQLGEGTVKKFNLKTGDEAVVLLNGQVPLTGELSERELLSQGAIDGLKHYGLNVHTEVITRSVNEDPYSQAAVDFLSNVLKKYPKVKAIVVDQGEVTGAMGTLLKRLDKRPGEYIVSGYSLSPSHITAIKEGYLNLVNDQQQYLEGYLPILQICLTKKYGFSGLYIDTGKSLVDSSNIDAITRLVDQKIR